MRPWEPRLKDQLDERLGQWLVRWVDAVLRRASATSWIVLGLTIPLAAYAALTMRINSDTVSLVSRDIPAFQNHDRFAALFPNLEHAFLIVIDADSPGRAMDAAEGLERVLLERPDRFDDVYLPGGGEFFERNGLLYRDVADLETFADEIAAIQPLIGELERDPGLANLLSLAQQGLEQVRGDGADAERWSQVLGKIGEATIRVYDEYPLAITWDEILLRGSAIEINTRRIVVAHPILDYGSVLAASAPLRVIREAAEELGLTPDRGVRVRVTGNPVLNYEEMIGIGWDIGVGGVFCFLLVAFVLYRALRSLRLAVASLATLLVGLIWTAAFAAVSVGHLNVVSMSFGILFIGLGVDFCIHLGMRYADLLRKGIGHEAALHEATRSVGSSLPVCSVTTAIGFFVFVPTSFLGVSELGLIAGAGMLVILFLTLTFFPALVSGWLRVDPERELADQVAWQHSAWHALGRHPRPILWVTAGVTALAAWGAQYARFDSNAVDLRDPGTESVQTFNDLLAQSGLASPWFINLVASDLDGANALAREVEGLDVVDSAVTLASYVPADQEEKLEILEDVAFMLDPTGATRAEAPDSPDVEEQVEAVRELHAFLVEAEIGENGGLLESSMRHLRDQLGAFLERVEADGDPRRALATLEEVLLEDLPGQIDRLRRAASATEVALEDLPPELVSRMIAADGQARVQVFPNQTLRDPDDLREFTEQVQAIDPGGTGIAINLIAFGQACQDSFLQALISAFVVIGLGLLLLWRSVRDTVLVLLPLLIAATCTVGTMVLFGVAFNFANLVVIPLLFGIGVDSGIHLVHRAKLLDWSKETLMGTTTARAVLYSAITTTISFGSLALSSHRGIESLGVLLIFGMAITVLANLVFLPALLDRWRPAPADPEASAGTE